MYIIWLGHWQCIVKWKIIWRLVLQGTENYKNLVHKMLLNLGEFTKNFLWNQFNWRCRMFTTSMFAWVCIEPQRWKHFLSWVEDQETCLDRGKLECNKACLLPSAWSKLFFFKSRPFLHIHSQNPILCFTISFPVVQITY